MAVQGAAGPQMGPPFRSVVRSDGRRPEKHRTSKGSFRGGGGDAGFTESPEHELSSRGHAGVQVPPGKQP